MTKLLLICGRKIRFSLNLLQERLSLTVTLLELIQPTVACMLHVFAYLSLDVDFAGGLKFSGQLDPMSSQEDDDDDELGALDITED